MDFFKSIAVVYDYIDGQVTELTESIALAVATLNDTIDDEVAALTAAIDAIGFPYASRFAAYASSGQTINITTFTKIQFGNESYDNNSEYDKDTNYRWTAKETGVYTFGSVIELKGIDDGKFGYAVIRKNGSVNVLYDAVTSPLIRSIFLKPYGDVALNVDDYLEVYVYHTDTGVRYTGVNEKCRFWGHRIA